MRQWIRSAQVQMMDCRLLDTKPLSNQCWAIVDWSLRNKLQGNFNQNAKFVIHSNAPKYIVCKWQAFYPREDDTPLKIRHSRISTTYPLPWASVHWLVQCTLECHWNATGWPSVHWDTTGPPSEYLQGTLEHHWKNLVETAPHWNATGEI